MEGSASGHDWQKVPCVHVNASHFSGTKSNSVDSKFHFFFLLQKTMRKLQSLKRAVASQVGGAKLDPSSYPAFNLSLL